MLPLQTSDGNRLIWEACGSEKLELAVDTGNVQEVLHVLFQLLVLGRSEPPCSQRDPCGMVGAEGKQ